MRRSHNLAGLLGGLIWCNLFSGCSDGSTTAGNANLASNNADPNQADSVDASSPARFNVSFGEKEGSVSVSGESVGQDANGILRWGVPGEAQLDVAFPYAGEAPRKVILKLVLVSPERNVILGSVSAKPVFQDGMLSYSVSLPVYEQWAGEHQCRIETFEPLETQAQLLHGGDLRINFVSTRDATE